MNSVGLTTAVTALTISPCASYIFAGVGPNLRVYSFYEHDPFLDFQVLDSGTRIYGLDCKEQGSKIFVAICGGRSFRVIVIENRKAGLRLGACGKIVATEDWIWNVKLSWGSVAVALSHSVLELWRLRVEDVVLMERIGRSTCEENEVTWSTGLWADDTQLVAGAGTSFGDIILWKVTIADYKKSFDQRAQGSRLRGHDGPVMKVVFSDNGEWLASASVDRTVRVWKKEGIFSRAALGFVEARRHYGHLGRVWDVAFWDQNLGSIVSVAEDKTCRLWGGTSDSNSATVLKAHSGSVWSVAAAGGRLVTGGEDSVIKVHKNVQLNARSDDRLSQAYQLPDDTDRPRKFGVAKDESVRCIKVISQYRMALATSLGRVIIADFPKEPDSTAAMWTVLYKHPAGVAFSPHTLQISCDLLFVGAVDGSIAILGLFSTRIKGASEAGEGNAENLVTVFDAFGKDKRMAMGLFVESKSSGHLYNLYVASPHGVLYLWAFNSKRKSAEFVAVYSPESPSRTSLVTAVLFAEEDNTLVVGDRGGRLLGFALGTEPSNGYESRGDSFETQMVHPISTTRPHCDRVSELTSFRGVRELNDAKRLKLYFSVGYDGLICQLRLSEGSIHIEATHRLAVRMDTICKLMFPTCKAYEAPLIDAMRMCVAGFRGAEFVVWNARSESAILREKCGNWHRPFDLQLHACVDSIDSVLTVNNCTFSYWRSGKLYIVRNRSKIISNDHDRKQHVVEVLGSGCHGLRVNDVQWVEGLESRGHLTTLISAGEDTDLRVTQILSSGRIDKKMQTLTEHTSGVTCVAMRRFDAAFNVLVSGAGMNELLCWVQSGDREWVLCGKTAKARPSRSKKVSSAAQHRVTCCAVLPFDGRDVTNIIVGRSDGSLGIVEFYLPHEGEGITVKPPKMVHVVDLHTGAVLSLSVVECCWDMCICFTGDTTGSVIAWEVRKGESIEKLSCLSSVHQSGVNAISAVEWFSSQILVVTGGDDETMKLLSFSRRERAFCSKSSAPRKHAAAITAVCAFRVDGACTYVLSTGADQKLICLKVDRTESGQDLKNYTISEVCNGIVSVTDPSSLDVVLRDSKIRIAVGGCGMEVLELL